MWYRYIDGVGQIRKQSVMCGNVVVRFGMKNQKIIIQTERDWKWVKYTGI